MSPLASRIAVLRAGIPIAGMVRKVESACPPTCPGPLVGQTASPDTFRLEANTPVYAMANGELIAARIIPPGAGVNMSFVLIRHEAFHRLTSVRTRAVNYWRGLTLPYVEPGVRLIRQADVEAWMERNRMAPRVEDYAAREMTFEGRRPEASTETLAPGTVLGTLTATLDLARATMSAPLPACSSITQSRSVRMLMSRLPHSTNTPEFPPHAHGAATVALVCETANEW